MFSKIFWRRDFLLVTNRKTSPISPVYHPSDPPRWRIQYICLFQCWVLQVSDRYALLISIHFRARRDFHTWWNLSVTVHCLAIQDRYEHFQNELFLNDLEWLEGTGVFLVHLLQTILKPFLLTTTFCQNIYPRLRWPMRGHLQILFYFVWPISWTLWQIFFAFLNNSITRNSGIFFPTNFSVSKQINSEHRHLVARLVLWFLHFNINPSSIHSRHEIRIACWCWAGLAEASSPSWIGIASLTYFSTPLTNLIQEVVWSPNRDGTLTSTHPPIVLHTFTSKTGPNRSLLLIHLLHMFLFVFSKWCIFSA